MASSNATASARRYALVSVAGVLVGFGLWATSPVLLGTSEPWDRGFVYYLTTLAVAGLILGAAVPTLGGVALSFAAVWLGQIVAVSTLFPANAMTPIAMIATGIGSLSAFLTGALSAFVWDAIGRRRAQSTSPEHTR